MHSILIGLVYIIAAVTRLGWFYRCSRALLPHEIRHDIGDIVIEVSLCFVVGGMYLIAVD